MNAVHKKPKLTFNILTDLYLKVAEQFRLVFTLPDDLRESLQIAQKSYGGFVLEIVLERGLFYAPVVNAKVIVKNRVLPS